MNPSEMNRQRAIARLRAVADLCERVPDLPVPGVDHVCVNRATDEAERAELDRIADLLVGAGLFVRRSDTGPGNSHHHVGAPSVGYGAFSVDASEMARHRAHMSYAQTVQPEPATT